MLEVKVGERIAKVKMLSRDENKIQIQVDEKIYKLDLIEVEKGIYSILKDNRSYNVELVQGDHAKDFLVNTYEESFECEIIDAEARYLMSRGGDDEDDGGRSISSPMPGKVIKIPVKVGDEIAEGTTVVIVEAMKMQSEYKVKADRVVTEILVKEGDAIDGGQPLIIVE
ncbi:MAG: acetyl-CoA carboxylase biotin carboxyl carrier protein subunit [Bacteroidetes bacterium 4572_77]|nr:MAG: acetyl-CoA carboxylase biotin carboxyl carrier protein subunit [Bacteroidetes bacterium 4572_77]